MSRPGCYDLGSHKVSHSEVCGLEVVQESGFHMPEVM